MISVILPTKNESLINELVEQVHDALNDYEHEIIIVDKSKETPA